MLGEGDACGNMCSVSLLGGPKREGKHLLDWDGGILLGLRS